MCILYKGILSLRDHRSVAISSCRLTVSTHCYSVGLQRSVHWCDALSSLPGNRSSSSSSTAILRHLRPRRSIDWRFAVYAWWLQCVSTSCPAGTRSPNSDSYSSGKFVLPFHAVRCRDPRCSREPPGSVLTTVFPFSVFMHSPPRESNRRGGISYPRVARVCAWNSYLVAGCVQTTFLSFKQGNVNAMRGKIREFDEAFQHEIVSAISSLRLSYRDGL